MIDLQTEIDRLVAIEEIHQLKARYFRLMDKKLWDDWGRSSPPTASWRSPRPTW